MDLPRCLVFLYLSCITLSGIAQPDLRYFSCDQSRNYTQNSTFQNNLNTLLSSLSSNHVDEYGFYNGSEGQNPDRASVVALCRGDVEMEICSSCVNDAARKLVQSCPNQKDAFGGYDKCMIRYSNESIIGSISRNHQVHMWNGENTTSPDHFNQDLRRLLDGLRSQAANGGSYLKFAADNTTGPDFQTIYALVQCTPDLTAQQCTDCLTSAFRDMLKCTCNGKRGGRILFPSCNFRYENYRFFNYTSIERRHNQGQKKGHKRKANSFVKSEESSPSNEIGVVESPMKFELSILQNATENFAEANKIGEGGFGVVYKSELENGELIAVKRLSSSRQGNLVFKNEVELIAKLQHKNLVKLLGYCQEEREMILVFEFVPNGRLDDILFDPVKRGYLNWERRYKIIENIARGLVYLHEDSRYHIIHRNLKANNILLDPNLNPKITDFGMARLFLFALNQAQGSTNTLVGTYGYVAPEYARYGKFSAKSDVYSFGVLVLEIISGQRNTIQNGEFTRDLLFDVWTNWKKVSASNVIDSILKGPSSPVHEIKRCIHVALLCVQESAVDRPKMSRVLQMLNRNSYVNPPEPLDLGFLLKAVPIRRL